MAVNINLNNVETTTNKGETVTGNEASTTKYLSTKGVYDWVTTNFKAIFSENTAFNKNFGTTAGTVAAGDDSRLSSSIHTTFSAALNPSDATTYYSMIIGGFPQVSIASSGMRFLRSGTITDFNIFGAHSANGSGESTSIYLRNVTTATDYLITSAWLENYGASTFTNQSYSGLSIPVGNTTDLWNIKIVYPTFATNPTTIQYSWGILLK